MYAELHDGNMVVVNVGCVKEFVEPPICEQLCAFIVKLVGGATVQLGKCVGPNKYHISSGSCMYMPRYSSMLMNISNDATQL